MIQMRMSGTCNDLQMKIGHRGLLTPKFFIFSSINFISYSKNTNSHPKND